ncbi:hypothetical protein B0H10DRAFT_2242872 [Mycena sp. CBHHK59/15]|nr:hypothetical protein B0H10DRAFT_2242872 [Mycena sp. CBHHK59/15]
MYYSSLDDSTKPDAPEDVKAWEFLRRFAVDEMTLPVAEEALQGFLGDKFSKTSIWRKTLGQLIGYEDGDEALKVLAQARSEFEPISSFPAPHCPADQLTSSENKLMEVIADLHQRKTHLDIWHAHNQ